VILIIFGLPETLLVKEEAALPTTTQPQTASEKSASGANLAKVSTRQSVQKKTKSFFQHLHRIFIDPLIVLTWMRFPPVALTVYYASITFGSLYFLNISLQATFSKPPYEFSTLLLGLLYIPGSLGYFLASLFGGRWIDKIMHREARKANRYDSHGKLIFLPEDRMRENAWLAAAMWPGALIWYGWTAENGVFWLAPMIANFFFGLGSMLIFSLATTMLTEFMPKRASAGVAVNNFFRSLFCFVGGVTAEPIIDAIGNGWLMTILGAWSFVSGIAVIWVMGRYGPRWRVKMEEALG
jgi:MFS family permease